MTGSGAETAPAHGGCDAGDCLRLAVPADAPALAALHARAFDAPWSEADIAVLLGQPGVFAVASEGGFVLCRRVVDEAEILTLAVRPEDRRRGLGARLTRAAADLAAQAGADRIFLEVAEDNVPARALYGRLGFVAAGRRPRYYARPGNSATDSGRMDALLLTCNLSDRLPTT